MEAGERVHSNNRYLQLDGEKKQMELSHKRARYELEKVASDSARDLEVHTAPIVIQYIASILLNIQWCIGINTI